MKPAGLVRGDRFRIVGGHRLEGAVRVSGAANAALPAMAAALLTSDECVVENVPCIDDIVFMAEILRSLGATVEQDPVRPDAFRINASGVCETTAPSRLVMTLRASFLVMGALLARMGEAACSPPGGDVLGQRPLDVHLSDFAALGARVTREGDKFVARAKELRGARVFLDYPSVLGTENILLAAVLARGHSQIVNAAAEPEIVCLANMLTEMGARIEGAGTHTLEVDGVEALHSAHHRVIPDRVEAGTFAIAAALTGGDVEVHGAVPRHMDALVHKMREMGVSIDECEGLLRVRRAGRLRPTQIQAVPYPGLATDLQAPSAVLLTQADGVSFVHERVYDNRFLYLSELRKFGAELVQAGATAVISGPTHLIGASARALDVRAGAALVLAGLAAEGETEISDVFHLDRKHENLEGKFRALGAQIERA
jgi:UDP-N-acetylglucosamine 1-carboxyvinyltransferase